MRKPAFVKYDIKCKATEEILCRVTQSPTLASLTKNGRIWFLKRWTYTFPRADHHKHPFPTPRCLAQVYSLTSRKLASIRCPSIGQKNDPPMCTLEWSAYLRHQGKCRFCMVTCLYSQGTETRDPLARETSKNLSHLGSGRDPHPSI